MEAIYKAAAEKLSEELQELREDNKELRGEVAGLKEENSGVREIIERVRNQRFDLLVNLAEAKNWVHRTDVKNILFRPSSVAWEEVQQLLRKQQQERQALPTTTTTAGDLALPARVLDRTVVTTIELAGREIPSSLARTVERTERTENKFTIPHWRGREKPSSLAKSRKLCVCVTMAVR